MSVRRPPSSTASPRFERPTLPRAHVVRRESLERIRAALRRGRPVVISGHAGAVGVGCTTLAAAFAEESASEFPDGIVRFAATVFDPYLIAIRMARAMGRDLPSLTSPGDAAGALSSLLDDRRVLIVLEDAEDPRIPLIFPKRRTALVCTSPKPDKLRALDAEDIRIRSFTALEADRYLQNLLGHERWKREMISARQVSVLLAHHPLALRLAFAPVIDRPLEEHPLIPPLAQALKARLRRLHKFSGEVRWVSAAFGIAIDLLDAPARAFLHALSVLPAVGFPREIAAQAADVDIEEASIRLNRLDALGLVQDRGGRYRLHPLIAELARGLGPIKPRLRRCAEAYLESAKTLQNDHEGLDLEIDGIFAGMRLAQELGAFDLVQDYADALAPYLDARGFRHEVPRRLQWGIAAARAQGDLHAQARISRWLGRAFIRQNAYDAARENLGNAARLGDEIEDAAIRRLSLLDLGRLELHLDRATSAIEALSRALVSCDHRAPEEGIILLELSRALIRAGRTHEALARLQTCAALADKRGDAMLSCEAEALLASLRPSTRNDGPPPARDEFTSIIQTLEAATRAIDETTSADTGLFPEEDDALDLAHTFHELIVGEPRADPPAAASSQPGAATAVPAANERSRPFALISPEARRALEDEAATAVEAGDIQEAERKLKKASDMALEAGELNHALSLLGQAGSLLLAKGDVSGGLEHLESCYALLDASGRRDEARRILHRIGRIATDVGDYDSALFSLLRSIESTEEEPHPNADTGEAYYRLGLVYAARGDHDDAAAHFDRAEEIWLETRHLEGLTLLLDARGRLLSRRGDRDGALRYFNRALELADALDNPRLYAGILHQKGTLAFQAHELDAARRHYERSLKIKLDLDDLDGMAITMHALGQVELARGERKKAREYLTRVLEIGEEGGNLRVQAASLRALGELALVEESFNEAEAAFAEADAIQQTLGEKSELAAIRSGMGQIKRERDDLRGALHAFEDAEAIAAAIGDRRRLAAIRYQLGGVYAELHQDDRAIDYLEAALRLDIELADPRAEAATRALLGQILLLEGRGPRARRHFRRALEIMESLGMDEASEVRRWLETCLPAA